MNKITPIIPIKLPMNSTVSLTSPTSGAQKIAIKKPVTIIGIPIPTVICFDGMSSVLFENIYEVYDEVYIILSAFASRSFIV